MKQILNILTSDPLENPLAMVIIAMVGFIMGMITMLVISS